MADSQGSPHLVEVGSICLNNVLSFLSGIYACFMLPVQPSAGIGIPRLRTDFRFYGKTLALR
jgi:hypothetical protein